MKERLRDFFDIPKIPKMIAIILAMTALLFFAVARGKSVGFSRLQRICTENTVGVIVDVDKKGSGGRGSIEKYRAEVIFEVKGKKYRFRTSWTRDHLKHGNITAVRYDPSDPENAYALSYPPLSGYETYIMGGVALGVCVAIFVKCRR